MKDNGNGHHKLARSMRLKELSKNRLAPDLPAFKTSTRASVTALRSSKPGEYAALRPLMMDLAGVIKIPPPTWLIDKVLPTNGIAVLYGPEKSGKSFVALDMAFHIATGRPWFGRAVRQGPVLYAAAEGHSGLGSRVRVLLHEKAQKGDEFGADMFVVPQPIPFHTLDGLRQLEIAIDDSDSVPALIVLDTFHACCPGIDENSAQDIGQFVDTANIVRRKTGATTMIIHHVRKGTKEYRGHSSIAGAADAMFGVTKDKNNVLTMSCRKLKEAPEFPDEFFELKQVRIPADPVKVKLGLAEDTVSCVIEKASLTTANKTKAKTLTNTAVKAANALVGGPLRYVKWRKASGLGDTSLSRARVTLQNKGVVLYNEKTMEYYLDPKFDVSYLLLDGTDDEEMTQGAGP